MKQNFGLYILESNYSKGNLSQKSHIEYFDSAEEASDNLKFKLWKYIASRVSVTNKISETYYRQLVQLKSIDSIDEFKRLRLPKYLSYSEVGERFSNANFYIAKIVNSLDLILMGLRCLLNSLAQKKLNSNTLKLL